MRNFFGTPRLMEAIVAVNFVMVISAYILAWIAIFAPAWVQFTDKEDNFYSIGLFNGCKNNVCGYMWSGYVQQWSVSQGVATGQWYYYNYAPTLVAVAQAFTIIGLVINTFSGCFWVSGSAGAAFATFLPIVFYTVGYSCAASFFLTASENYSVLGLTSGYAAECAIACYVLMWLAVIVFIADAVIKEKNDQVESTPEPMVETMN